MFHLILRGIYSMKTILNLSRLIVLAVIFKSTLALSCGSGGSLQVGTEFSSQYRFQTFNPVKKYATLWDYSNSKCGGVLTLNYKNFDPSKNFASFAGSSIEITARATKISDDGDAILEADLIDFKIFSVTGNSGFVVEGVIENTQTKELPHKYDATKLVKTLFVSLKQDNGKVIEINLDDINDEDSTYELSIDPNIEVGTELHPNLGDRARFILDEFNDGSLHIDRGGSYLITAGPDNKNEYLNRRQFVSDALGKITNAVNTHIDLAQARKLYADLVVHSLTLTEKGQLKTLTQKFELGQIPVAAIFWDYYEDLLDSDYPYNNYKERGAEKVWGINLLELSTNEFHELLVKHAQRQLPSLDSSNFYTSYLFDILRTLAGLNYISTQEYIQFYAEFASIRMNEMFKHISNADTNSIKYSYDDQDSIQESFSNLAYYGAKGYPEFFEPLLLISSDIDNQIKNSPNARQYLSDVLDPNHKLDHVKKVLSERVSTPFYYLISYLDDAPVETLKALGQSKNIQFCNSINSAADIIIAVGGVNYKKTTDSLCQKSKTK